MVLFHFLGSIVVGEHVAVGGGAMVKLMQWFTLGSPAVMERIPLLMQHAIAIFKSIMPTELEPVYTLGAGAAAAAAAHATMSEPGLLCLQKHPVALDTSWAGANIRIQEAEAPSHRENLLEDN